MADVEVANKENIFDLINSVYESMIKVFDDISIERIKTNVELLKRDCSKANLKICLDDLQDVHDTLYKEYHGDDLITLLQVRINECKSLFGLVPDADADAEDEVGD